MNNLSIRPCKDCRRMIFFAYCDSTKKSVPLDRKAACYSIEKDIFGDMKAVRTDAFVSHVHACPEGPEWLAMKRAKEKREGKRL